MIEDKQDQQQLKEHFMTGNNKGFTLIEVLVAISIFAVVSVVATDLFLLFNKSQRRIQVEQEILANGRNVLSKISEVVRLGQIDYGVGSLGASNPVSSLPVINESDQAIEILRETDCRVVGDSCISLSGVPFTSENINVDDFIVQINPLSNPFPVQPMDDPTQPSVNVSFSLSSIMPDGEVVGPVWFQTVVSPRYYGN